MTIPISKIREYAKKGDFAISEKMVNDILRENASFLAHHPLDVLIFDFDRELKRFCEYLKLDHVRHGYTYVFRKRKDVINRELAENISKMVDILDRIDLTTMNDDYTGIA